MSQPIDYWAIRDGISLAIRKAPELGDLKVLHELGRLPAPEEVPCVLVYLAGRTVPPDIQRISGGRSLHYRLTFSTWVLHYSLDSLEEAVRRRDRILAKVELALMADRTLGGLVPNRAFWFEGGDVEWNRDPVRQAFVSAIESRLVYEIPAEL